MLQAREPGLHQAEWQAWSTETLAGKAPLLCASPACLVSQPEIPNHMHPPIHGVTGISTQYLALTTCLLVLKPRTVLRRCEALLKVVGSRPEHLVPNFFTLLPSGTPTDFQRILDIKVLPA